jgi:hypothetical protein
MNYAQSITFLTKMKHALLTLPIDIQKYIGTFHDKKYDNKYIRTMVIKSACVKIPEQIKYESKIQQISMNNITCDDKLKITKLYQLIESVDQLSPSMKAKKLNPSKIKRKHPDRDRDRRRRRHRQRKYKRHIIDGQKLKQKNNSDSFSNPTYFENYCNLCKFYYCDTDRNDHVPENNRIACIYHPNHPHYWSFWNNCHYY